MEELDVLPLKSWANKLDEEDDEVLVDEVNKYALVLAKTVVEPPLETDMVEKVSDLSLFNFSETCKDATKGKTCRQGFLAKNMGNRSMKSNLSSNSLSLVPLIINLPHECPLLDLSWRW